MVAYLLARSLSTFAATAGCSLLVTLLVDCGSRSTLDSNVAGGAVNSAGGTGGTACPSCSGGTLTDNGGSTPLASAGFGNISSAGGTGATGGSASANRTSCTFEGKEFAIGQGVPGTSDCNTCTCQPTGQVVCSLIDCHSSCPGLPLVTDLDAGSTCVGVNMRYEPAAMDIFLLVERSSTMSDTLSGTSLVKWDAVEQGLKQFLSSPEAASMQTQVALEFFGATGNPDDPLECNAETYSVPDIDFTPAASAGNAVFQAFMNQRVNLSGETPWLPALQGALLHAQQWQVAHPTRKTTVIFITSSLPTECDLRFYNLLELVGEFNYPMQGLYNSMGAPSIRTHFVGIAASSDLLYNMNSAAEAGGTEPSVSIDGASSSDDLANLLTRIVNGTGSEWPCTLTIPRPPDGPILDFSDVHLIYTPYSGEPQRIPLVARVSDCGRVNGGSYFDDPSNPQLITLCPCSCANLAGGSLAIDLGCSR